MYQLVVLIYQKGKRMRFHSSKLFLIVAAILFTITSSGHLGAQTSVGTSSVTGVIRDTSGAAVSHAHIVLLDKQHGTSRDTTANNQGEYLFPGVLPGIYAIRVDQPGFQTTTVDNVQVVIDQSATVNPVLAVGNVSQTVEVNSEGATPLLDTSSNALGDVINNTLVEQLPLNGRDFLQLAQLSGGVLPSTTSNQTGHPSLTLEIAGTSQWNVGFNIDGIETRSPRIANSSLNISVAAIDQFKIEMGFFLPDKGPQMSIIDVATKAGTNKVHGEMYEFFRNRDLNAYQYVFPGTTGATKDDLHRNQFGFSIGGPVVLPKLFNGRDKLFFFGNYEGLRQTDKNVSNVTTPTLAMFGGDFRGTGLTIYNPYSYNSTTNQRDAFQNDEIPPGMINSLSKSLLAYYLSGDSYPLSGGATHNLTGYPVSTLRDDQFTVRMDATLSSRQQIYANVSYEDSPALTASIFPLAGTSNPLKAALAVIQHTETFGPHLVNIFRIGYDRAYTFNAGEGADGPLTERQIGINGTLDGHGIPSIGMTGFTGFGNAYSKVGEISNAYQLTEALNYLRGNHSFAFGTGIIYHRTLQQNSNAGARGSMTFQDIYTTQTVGGTTGGSAFADFLLGLPLSGSVAGFQPIHYRFTEYYPYFQDSWRVAPTFTINYGTAWYYSGVPNPQGPDAQLSHVFNFSTGLLEYSALGQISPKVIEPDNNNWAPRLGFVWAPSSLPNTTMRAGFGVYYGQWGLNDIQFATFAPPFSNSLPFTNSKTTDLPAVNFTTGVFPVITQAPLTDSYAANIPPGTSPDIIDPHSRTPYYMQWNLAVQHTFGVNDLVEADYLGNMGHKGSNRYEVDQCPYQTNLFCDNTKKPYPQYTSLFYIDYSTNNNYNGLILKYEHHLSHGLTMLANYTYQKSLTDGFEPNGPYGADEQNGFCRRCDYGLVSYSIPHSIVVSAVYDLPFGRGRQFGSHWSTPLDAVAGGWQLSLIGSMQHGTAAYVISPNQTQSSGNEQRANQLCNGNSRDVAHHLRTNGYVYFKTNCYATPPSGYFGNSSRAPLWTPGVDSWTMATVKSFPIHDRLTFQLRGEAFNVFNHANFGNPDDNTGDIVSKKFGVVSSAAQPRLVQIAAKVVW